MRGLRSRLTGRRGRPALLILAIMAVLAVLGGVLVWQAGNRSRAIRNLPESERRPLFERTVANVRMCHRVHSPKLEGFCEEQANLLLSFPDCDATCRKLAWPLRPAPTR